MLKIGKISSHLSHFKLKEILERISNPIEVVPDQKYTQIGIRSHGKGIFIKEEVTGAELGNKRVFWIEPDCFIVNIVFAWERAVSRTTSDLEGLIASHRFPMYKVNNLKVDLDYFTRLFLTKKGQMLLELASPGGAGRNKTLGQKEFLNLEIDLPTLEIQKFVSSFLKYVDKKILLQQEKIDLLEEQKKGYMQKIFSQELRFKDDNGHSYTEWTNKKIKNIFTVTRGKVLATNEISNNGKYPVFSSQTKNNGLLGYYDDYLFENAITWTTDGANAGDTKYRKGKFYCTNVCGVLLNENGYANNFMAELINSVSHKYVSYVGNPKLMNNVMGEIELNIPIVEEQLKIANFINILNSKILLEKQKLESFYRQKQAFMQKMFI